MLRRLLTALTLLSCAVSTGAGFVQQAEAKSLFGDHELIALKKPTLATTDPVVTLETSRGPIKIVIYKKIAPITAGNFIDLVQRGFYNGITFHRYEPGMLIQGGDPQGNGFGSFVDPVTKTERKIPLEVRPELRHSEAGMLAMARMGDPDSASSQFYITLSAQPKLDGQFAVFGKVIDGMPALMGLRKGDKIVHAEVKEPGAK